MWGLRIIVLEPSWKQFKHRIRIVAVTRINVIPLHCADKDQDSNIGCSDQIFDNLKDDELLTAEELAYRLNVAVQTIRKWRFEGYLPPDTMLKLRQQVRYKWERVLFWLENKET